MNGKLYDFILKPVETFHLGHIRDSLLSSARGKTLEIGAGTGLNFSHYPQGIEVVATDYDENMLKAAKKHGLSHHVKVEVADAQNLPYPDNEFDTVVATLVFCSIPDPDKALREVHRVLKPGGSFLLLEHVRRNTPVAGKILDTLTPVWKNIAGGCHLNRDPEKTIHDLGFKIESRKTIWNCLGKIWHLKK
ncbi:MAG: class I SAM-dependent methyltransferase [Bacteriovoracia bacterium]